MLIEIVYCYIAAFVLKPGYNEVYAANFTFRKKTR